MPPSGANGCQLHYATGQCAIPYAYRHDWRLSQLRADRCGTRSRHQLHPLGTSQPDHFVDRAWTGVFGQDHAPALPCLQFPTDRVHPDHNPSSAVTQPEEAQQPAHAFGRVSSPLSSSVSSDTNAMSWSEVSPVIPGIFAMSSRSRSRMSLRVL